MSKVIPCGAKMIVEPFKVLETASGVVRIDQGHSTPVKGTVVASGRGSWWRSIKGSQFEKGDVVFFRRYSVDELKIPQEDGSEKSMFMVEDSDVVAKLVE